ncbi:hypothetical protein [Thermogemmatispora tikiterensis]|uniref:Uncharacterized protein n=1 Tax=Thermogemmatispora tikiterensis TaxID=1825093 RepID=A0A328V9H4_9CHLR|nr:hypothetical protein [Thermogemmatispora tikiterensis]RAQ94198.1 hypothetical protein A4R35_01545 [Thermogemmatispora tikiterensis]
MRWVTCSVDTLRTDDMNGVSVIDVLMNHRRGGRVGDTSYISSLEGRELTPWVGSDLQLLLYLLVVLSTCSAGDV